MKTRCGIAALLLCAGLAAPVTAMEAEQPPRATSLSVTAQGGESIVSLSDGTELARTSMTVRAARLTSVPGSAVRLALWEEVDAGGSAHAKFAVSLDGRKYSDVYDHDHTVHLRYAVFNPSEGEPMVPADLEGSGVSSIYIVQFEATPLDVFREGIEAAGGTVYNYMASNGYLCKLDGEALAAVKAMPFVRWVGVYQPAYRIDQNIVDAHFGRPGQVTGSPFGRESVGPTATDDEFAAGAAAVFNIQVFERGLGQKRIVADAVRAIGGSVQAMIPDGFLVEARLTRDQLAAIAQMDEVLFIDPWSPGEPDMDNIRVLGGADFLEMTLGMTGQGVRGEVNDTGVLTSHVDLVGPPGVLMHTSPSSDDHGTHSTGIVFGRGVGQARARGLLPNAEQPIGSVYFSVPNRFTHTAQLVDPAGPYRAVFQTNSWGGGLTTDYTSTSQQMDDILFQHDIVILNSQSNASSTLSRPEAWAKNIVSVGGISHFNNQSWEDDRYTSASRGPAFDGRIKPDLASMYEGVWSSASFCGTSCYSDFGGTSAATPITAGHFGIMFQMWHQGTFAGHGGGASVFASRPHMTTAKALMINSARQWDMTLPGTNIRREHQGWGHANLANLYNMRDKMLIVNETEVLTALQSKTYTINVAAGEPALKATLTWADRPGTTSSSQHRINLLTLKVTNPAGTTFYWGNNGLAGTGMWSTSGGVANTKDTVQNVFVQNPVAGDWTIEVRADALPQDGRVETAGVTDADFALVVSGGTVPPDCRVDLNGDGFVDFADYLVFLTYFDTSDLRADFNGDGFVDFADYLVFLNEYDAGC